jgi:cation diffusion facilitator family transporter
MAGCNSCASDLTTKEESTDPLFRRILWIALVSNGVMFFAEIIGSIVSGSVSLQADALDFFGDAANYGISLFVLGMAINTRAKAALFKGASMALFGIYVIGNAIFQALNDIPPDHTVMGILALLALLVNAGVALLLFRYRAGDSNMRSIWLCSRNDALGNIAVMVAAVGVMLTSSQWPDLLVAILIAGLNLSAAVQVIKQARDELRPG